MFDKARSFVASHHDASQLVKEAEKFSVRLPIVGRIAVPPPDQLAFFGVLGALAALGAIEWPVAAAIGVGQVVVSRHFSDSKPDGEKQSPAPPRKAVAAKAPAVAAKAPAKKAPAKKAAAAKKTPAKKVAVKKAPAKKAGNQKP
jgi:septal ring-binding cell division protein DamX